MLLASTVLFASLSAASPGPLASTYADAACDAAEPVAITPQGEADCRPPAPAPAPAVIDCNDEREPSFVADMIGSCDMPRASGTPALARAPVAPATPLSLCDGIECTRDSSPLRPASRAAHHDQPIASAALVLPRWDVVSGLVTLDSVTPPSRASSRIERPPRSSR